MKSLIDRPIPTSAEGLKAFSLTFVQYDPTDRLLGKPMAIASLLPIFMIVSYLTIIAVRRDVLVALMFLGQLLNEGLNLIAKKSIKEPRPTGNGYGYPSSHSQFMTFFATFISLHIFLRLKYKRALWKPLLAFGNFAMAALVAYSRVHLFYHTYPQVVAGSLIGVVTGALWYFIADLILHPIIAKSGILDSYLAKWARIRDSRDIDDVVYHEYLGTLAAKKNRKKTR
ncbi:Dolichyldiphosphatase 1 [Chytridiales sp. JEL 0842]|nr:Dolichyldiphosphatase 1 [Chytridiales sp. JEL 0842]